MNSLVLVMAGKGQRMNKNINKILLPLGDKPIYEYSINLFKEFDFEIICVINKDDEIIKEDGIIYTYGGKTRSESVYNGLKIAKGDYVFIHDAARPLLSKEVIINILNNLNKNEAYLTYLESVDTLKEIDNDKIITLDRNKIIRALTPQCAKKDILIDSYDKAFKDNKSFTDDISLIEEYHKEVKINLVKSNPENFKITTEFDYELAKVLVKKND